MSESFDIIIIGGGIAGTSAALTAMNRGKRTVVIANPMESESLYKAEKITNYPGLAGLSGREMSELLRRQLVGSGAKLIRGRALNVMDMGGSFGVAVGNDFYEAKAVILALGITREKLYPGEAEFLGRGVSYCVTCDGMLYRGKKVCVVGFTSDTQEEADLLRTMGCDTEVFTSRAAKYAVLGGERVTALSVNGAEHPCEAVFILRPAAAPDTLLAGLAMDGVHVAVDKVTMKTSVAGVFAAGDCTGKPYQIAKAVGDGNIAALSAAQYIEERSRGAKA